MADTFKKQMPLFEFFRDGEQVRIKKLGTIIKNIQKGVNQLDRVIGDIYNHSNTFIDKSLFQNSIGRAIGSMANLDIDPPKTFDTVQTFKNSLHQGLIKYPETGQAASLYGSKSSNLLPSFEQVNKIGIGCINDEGARCLAGYSGLYLQNKSIVPGFSEPGDSWTFDGGAIYYQNNYLFLRVGKLQNLIHHSESFNKWDKTNNVIVVDKAAANNDGYLTASLVSFPNISGATLSESYLISANGQPDSLPNKIFSIWAKSVSGTNQIVFETSLGISGGDPYGAAVYNKWIVNVDDIWRRYYCYGQNITSSSWVRIYPFYNNTSSDKSLDVYLDRAQWEPGTTYPGQYIKTENDQGDPITAEPYILYATASLPITTIPGQKYLLKIKATPDNTETVYGVLSSGIRVSIDGSEVLYLSGAAGYFQTTFIANKENSTLSFYNKYTSLSGVIFLPMTLPTTGAEISEIVLSPSTPCHALNCPGFSAYNTNREYRAVLPNITISGHQFFSDQLQLPSNIGLSFSASIPSNILGIFDYEINKMVPNKLVDWRLANWQVSNLTSNTLVSDSEFLDDWMGADPTEYPLGFTPSGVGVLNRGETVISAVYQSLPSDIPNLEGWWKPEVLKEDFANGQPIGGNLGPANGLFWRDSSPSQRNMVSGAYTGGQIGYIDYSGINGYPMVVWDDNVGETFRAEQPQFSPIIGLESTGYTMIAVSTDKGCDRSLLTNNLSNATTEHYGFYFDCSSDRLRYYYASNTSINVSTAVYDGAANPTVVFITVTPSRYVTVENNGVNETDGTPQLPAGTFNQLGSIGAIKLADPSAYRDSDGMKLSEIIFYNRPLTSSEKTTVYNYLSSKYNIAISGISSAGFGLVSTLQDSDFLEIQTSGNNYKGISRQFALETGKIYIWEYKIKGDLATSGVREVYKIINGGAEVDLLQSNEYTTLTNAETNNYYQVSGITLPGETNWSKLNKNYWVVTRKIRPTQADTVIELGLGSQSFGNDQTLYVDSFDVYPLKAESVKFSYSKDPILGYNWQSEASHVRNENLFKWSDKPYLSLKPQEISKSFVLDVSGVARGISFQDPNYSYVYYDFDTTFTKFKDTSITIKFDAKTGLNNYIAPPALIATQGSSTLFSGTYSINTGWQTFRFLISGLDPTMEEGALSIKWYLPSGTNALDLSAIQIYHGSGIVDYVAAQGTEIETYRKQIQTTDLPLSTWSSGYGLVMTNPLLVKFVGATDNGEAYVISGNSLTDFNNFPTQGAFRIGNQEVEYKNKSATAFVEARPNWRGTPFDLSVLYSGMDIIHIPLPQKIKSITNNVIEFENTFPAADGDWANPIKTAIYNVSQYNTGRWALVSNNTSVTKATGDLITGFIQHAADPDLHFNREQLCSAIVNPGQWCLTDDITARVTLIKDTIQELIEQAILNIELVGFLKTNTKIITINWGDGNTSTYSGKSNIFQGLSHTYDLGPIVSSRTYTIRVSVFDEQMGITRNLFILIKITPQIKFVQASRAVMTIPASGVQISSAAIIAQSSGIQISRAYLQ